VTYPAAAALAAAAAVLAAVTAATARRPAEAVPDRAEYFRRWSPLHGGYDPTGTAFTGRWLALAHAAARPLAGHGVAPDALTGWGLLLSVAVPVAAAGGGRWPLAAVAVVVLAGLLDNLDGAVAVLTGRATRFGSVLDSLADRVSDAAYVAALAVLGAPGWLCVAGGGLAGLQEYGRARAGACGMTELAVLTVWERPTRIVLTAFLLLGCGLLPGSADRIATGGAAAWVAFGLVGLGQLLVAVRRRLG